MPKEHKLKVLNGVTFPAQWTDFHCLLWLFHFAPRLQVDPHWRPAGAIDPNPCPVPYDGFGRFQHSRQIAEMLFGKAFEWHEFSEKVVQAACEAAVLAITGCGASSKSTSIALYSLEFWQCAPLDSAVIVASKTIESAKKRIWREISRFYSIFSHLLGGYKDAQIGSSPRPFIMPVDPKTGKKDEAHGLFVTALHGQELEKEIGYIKGFHPRRILVVADELDALEEGGKALVQTFNDNLATGADEAQLIVLGNDPSLLNALGDLMQPEIGKPVTLANKEWISAKGVRCIRLDAWDSPNVTEPGKYTGLVGQKDIDRITKNGTELNTPSVYIQLHGIHPPEGADQTVLSEAAFIRFKCFEKVTWRGSFIISASLDPGFGGDACLFRTFRRGQDDQFKLRIAIDEIITIPIDASDTYNPPEYQIAEKVKALCLARGIPPDEFVIGATGIGRGSASVLQREWSPRIVVVEEGGGCSDMPVSDEDPRPAHEIYDRKVTELHFSIRQFVESDLIRNLDLKTAGQLAARKYEEKGKKKHLEKKEDFKERTGESPNEEDAFAFYIHLLREKGINAVATGAAKVSPIGDTLERHVEAMDFDAMEECYSSEYD